MTGTPPDAEPTARIESNTPFTPPPRAHDPQFAPGTVIAGRYRISSILGKGGMGEVYRADDIKLGQPVALKFLPARLERDPMLLARLHDEVRHGRQIAHPNVCRTYDIAEWNGAHFVAMEYVDGEDLARLLHRIGRLPHDKAIDIARGVAAGLLAAHSKGILHRDLKPANVMLDSHGEARITDFGLALSATDDQEGDVAGTPAYMAPEQLQGSPATVQSDLYALGLVMYELFTGKRAHAGKTFPDRLREITSEITVPSTHIRDLDPAVERVILRCLASDPAQRPRSARQVIEALPGGDPLAAAMAAGETPSPRIVAAAGSEGRLRPAVAWTLLAIIMVLSLTTIAARRWHSMSRFVPFDRSPEVLLDRAETIARDLGVPLPGKPIRAIHHRPGYLDWLPKQRPAPVETMLRNGPGPLVFRLEYGVSARESALEPLIATAPGRTSIDVDMAGRLSFLLSAPRHGDIPARPLDWNKLLQLAGLSTSSLAPIAPRHAPPVPFDARAAWSGTFPGNEVPIRVEAAAWRGMPVFFRITGDWEESSSGLPRMDRPFRFVTIVSMILVTVTALLAWRNFRRRRGDRAGALRVGIAMYCIATTSTLLQWNYAADTFDAVAEVFRNIADGLGFGALGYVMYLAIEPYLRQRWPDRVIAWARLLSGRLNDPMVGRDTLIGVTAGAVYTTIASSVPLLPASLSKRVKMPEAILTRALVGVPEAIGEVLSLFLTSAGLALLSMTVLVIASIVLRNRLAAVAVLFAVTSAVFLLASTVPLVVAVTLPAILTYVPYRHGFLATVLIHLVHGLLFLFPTIAVPWGTTLSLIPYATLAAMALWAFRTSLGGESPFGGMLEEA